VTDYVLQKLLLKCEFGNNSFRSQLCRLSSAERIRLEPRTPESYGLESAGELSGVLVEWSYLDQKSGETRKLGEHEFVILVDRRENTSLAEVRSTLQHESCHVFLGQESEEHGPMFQACMKLKRFGSS